jgi:hypothetical protein
MRVALTLPTLVLLCFVSTAHAQRRPEFKTLNTAGTIKGVRPQVLLVTAEGGQEWFVSVPSDYKQFSYEASATSRWLQPRMPVRFKAEVKFEKRRKDIVIEQPVTALTVAPITPELMPGYYPEQSNDQRTNLFARRTADTKEKKRQGPVTMTCLIVGQLLEAKDGKLRVAAGPAIFRLELDPEAEIDVQWYDVQWVRPGDKIELSARHPVGRLGQAQGQQMSITAAELLDIQPKPTRTRRSSQRDSKKPAESKKAGSKEDVDAARGEKGDGSAED